MSIALQRIKEFMKMNKLSASKLAIRLNMPARTMQLRLKEDNFKIEELEQIQAIYGIQIFHVETIETIANEPVSTYGNKQPVNITIQLSADPNHKPTEFERMLTQGLAEMLANRAKQNPEK